MMMTIIMILMKNEDGGGRGGDEEELFDEITVFGHSYLSKLARPQSQRSLQ